MGDDVSFAPAGWYAPDPAKPSELRYWDGQQWTDHVATGAPSESSQQSEAASQTGTLQVSGRYQAGPSQDNLHSTEGGGRTVTQLNAENTRLRHEVKQLEAEVARLRAELVRLGGTDAVVLDAESKRLATAVQSLEIERAQLERQISNARDQVVEIRDGADFQDVGLYSYHHPAESSVELSADLDAVRADIKRCVRDKAAISASSGITFSGSKARGTTFVNQMSRIMLRAYNAEAENCVKTVKAGNLPVAQARLRKAMDSIEKQGQMIELRITEKYHRLRLKELELAADYNMMVQQEREMERERKAELREQQQAEKELRAERKRLEKELAHYTNVMQMLEKKGDSEAATRLQDKLADVQHAIENVDYRTANIRAGFVYVISNIGSFGENMVKIGLTRRLEPMDRVRELGDASVPFRFDVHTLFFADDAVTVENNLHKAFAEKRVNKINLRREFFYATPEDVLQVLRETVGEEVVEYRSEPEAEEFRLSRGEVDTVL
jgi:predicted RNase H-like nuclease (RuvC/YqgF family)